MTGLTGLTDSGGIPMDSPRTDPLSSDLARFGQHPATYLVQNAGTQQFRDDRLEGLVAYWPAGKRFFLTIGGLLADPADRPALLDSFLAFAKRHGRRVIAVHFLRDDAQLLASRGFRINQIGASYSIDLRTHTLTGSDFATLRNKISRARRKGVEVLEVGVDLPYEEGLKQQMDEIDREWLQQKGKKELDLLIGEMGSRDGLGRERHLYVTRDKGQILGYIQYSPAWGIYSGWVHDLSRRRREIPVGTMEYANVVAMDRFRKSGSHYLHFGFTPMTSLAPDHEIQGAYSEFFRRLMVFLQRHGRFIYPAESQLQYKRCWRPTDVIPEYVGFQGGASLRGVWSFLRATNSI
jgi:lysylphosphatidylglycerol synthetase-like protein (DUF2156 family)